ncbi:alpha/beta fold hydrolase [Streptomyces sp. NPDC059982]|uniref:alpha/beta fold hydrolase n=1 Tax=unclassified Streptomyces TaxID=2593676 RepID=UPI00343318E4
MELYGGLHAVSVPDEWSESIKLHGVLDGGELVASVTEKQGCRTVYVRHESEWSAGIDIPSSATIRVSGGNVYMSHASVVTKLMPDRDVVLAAPAPVAGFATNAEAAVTAVLTGGPTPAVQLYSKNETRCLLESSPARRPVEIDLCPAGCHLVAVVRTVEGRQAYLFDTASGELGTVIPGVGRIATLLSGCRFVAVDDTWPLPNIITASAAGGPVLTHPVDASVLCFVEDASGPQVHCTRPEQAPALVPLEQLLNAGLHTQPQHSTVPTRWGQLRVLTIAASSDPIGDVVMLHGGPYGVWVPRWDPQVELLVRNGYQVHQLEAPYTASLRRDHARFAPGDFGIKDVESVTDAVTAIGTAHQRPVLLFGFSYGGLLAARTAAVLGEQVTGVFLMSAIWRSKDLQQLIDDGRPAPGDLQSFLAHAFPGRHVDLPEVDLPSALATAVVHSTNDTIAPFPLIEAACAANPRAVFTPLLGEDHIPRRGSSVVKALHALQTWLQHCEGTTR